MSRKGENLMADARASLGRAAQETHRDAKLLNLLVAYGYLQAIGDVERKGSPLNTQAGDMGWQILDQVIAMCPRTANPSKDAMALADAAEAELAQATANRDDPKRAIQDLVLAAYYAGAAIQEARRESSAKALDRAHSVFFKASQFAQTVCGIPYEQVQASYAPNVGQAPEEKDRRRKREERAAKSQHKRRRDRAYSRRAHNPLGTLEDLPKGKRMWEAVYRSARDRGFPEDRSAQQAWGAVKAAGYTQDDKGVWHAPRDQNQAGPAFSVHSQPAPRPAKAPLPSALTGPLRVKSQSDGMWVVGRGLAVPVESRNEGRYLIGQLERRRNPPDVTQLRFSSHDDLAKALHVMDVALKPTRHARPVMFEIDWDTRTIALDGAPDDPGVSNALAALDYAKIGFDANALPYAANPAGGSPGRAAGYAFLGNVVGSILGFGLGALVGALAGAALAGGAGAGLGLFVGGGLGAYGGSIYGAGYGAAEGAPTGREKDAKVGGAIGAAIPWVSLFTAPLGAYLGAD